jgi:malate dehydrogenase (oxaloacetate-decarboxylating)
MFMSAAKALAAMSPACQDRKGRLLPPISSLRDVTRNVAQSVAKQAQDAGDSRVMSDNE